MEVYDSGDGVNSGSEDEEYGGGLTSLNLLEPIGQLCDSASLFVKELYLCLEVILRNRTWRTLKVKVRQPIYVV